MGEYAKLGNQEIKIGTCENMYYLRYEDRLRVTKCAHSLDPARETGLRFRLPFPDEDSIQPGNYEPFERGIRLFKRVKDERTGNTRVVDYEFPDSVEDPGSIQLTHKSGLLINVKCYHNERLPKANEDINVHWNGKTYAFELCCIKSLPDNKTKPVIWCQHCRQMWACDWKDILEYINDEVLRERLEVYANESE